MMAVTYAVAGQEETMRRTILTAILAIAAILGGRTDAHPPWGIAVDDRGRMGIGEWLVEHGGRIQPTLVRSRKTMIEGLPTGV
jgi:hypothetical protein